MSMKISPGKQKGMEAVSNERGVIGAAAMDQRGSLKSAIAKDKGVDKKAVTDQMMAEFKEAVTRILTPHATAILLDPEYGLSATKVRSKNAGLLLAYEKSGVWSPPEPIASRSCSTTRLSIRPPSTKPSMPGSNA
jgi:tagatose 1,6-diphosphate aldolase